jgi:hypothetical protein
MAQSNVYSLNVVGYVNKVITGAGEYTGVANPLKGQTNTLGALLGSLPVGSQVLKWNPALVDYDSYARVAFGNGWLPASGADVSLSPGEGCLVRTPAASGDVTNTFVGEVLQGSLTNSFPAGYKLVGNMVPDSGAVTNASINLTPPNGSSLLKWNPAIDDFNSFAKVAFGSGWLPAPPSIDVAEGFFVNASSPFDWVRNFTVAP